MSVKITADKFSRAEDFLVRLAASVSGSSQTAGIRDIEASVRRVAHRLATRVEAGELDSVLSVLDRALKHEPGPASTRPPEIDPYFWG